MSVVYFFLGTLTILSSIGAKLFFLSRRIPSGTDNARCQIGLCVSESFF